MPYTYVPDLVEMKNALQSMLDAQEENIVRRIKGISANNETSWLSLEEAKLILPIKSKKKWKQLRDDCEVDFTKAGRAFLYDKNSIVNYLNNNSTLRKTKRS